jgi:four helix bundle protein
MGKGYEDLEVWQKAQKIASEIYLLTKNFPPEDRYSFVSQIRKSSLSIASNIAEGATRNSKKEFIQFISYTHGSCS